MNNCIQQNELWINTHQKGPYVKWSTVDCNELQTTWQHVQHVGDILHGSIQIQVCNDHANAWLCLIWYKWGHYPAIYQEQVLHNISLHYQTGYDWQVICNICENWTVNFFKPFSFPLSQGTVLERCGAGVIKYASLKNCWKISDRNRPTSNWAWRRGEF